MSPWTKLALVAGLVRLRDVVGEIEQGGAAVVEGRGDGEFVRVFQTKAARGPASVRDNFSSLPVAKFFAVCAGISTGVGT